MKQKSSIVRNVCEIIGGMALVIYCFIAVGFGVEQNVFQALGILTASVGLIAYSIKCIIEIALEGKLSNSIFFMCIFIVDIFAIVMKMLA